MKINFSKTQNGWVEVICEDFTVKANPQTLNNCENQYLKDILWQRAGTQYCIFADAAFSR